MVVDKVTQVQILDEAIRIFYSVNALGNFLNSTIFFFNYSPFIV